MTGPSIRTEETNPFRPPSQPIDPGPVVEAEIIRRSYLAHESKVRSLGLLGYLAAGLALVLALVLANELFGWRPLTFRLLTGRWESTVSGVLVAWLVALAAVAWGLGFGLRRLAPWARWATVAADGVAFLGYLLRYALALSLGTHFFDRPGQVVGNTLGLLASGYVLLVVGSRRGARVFGPEYRAVVRQTPEIRPFVSGFVKVVLAGALTLAGVVAFFVVLDAIRRG